MSGCLGEQERSTAWSLFFLALYLDVVVAFEVPQLALNVCPLDWSIRGQKTPSFRLNGRGLRVKAPPFLRRLHGEW